MRRKREETEKHRKSQQILQYVRTSVCATTWHCQSLSVSYVVFSLSLSCVVCLSPFLNGASLYKYGLYAGWVLSRSKVLFLLIHDYASQYRYSDSCFLFDCKQFINIEWWIAIVVSRYCFFARVFRGLVRCLSSLWESWRKYHPPNDEAIVSFLILFVFLFVHILLTMSKLWLYVFE